MLDALEHSDAQMLGRHIMLNRKTFGFVGLLFLILAKSGSARDPISILCVYEISFRCVIISFRLRLTDSDSDLNFDFDSDLDINFDFRFQSQI